jgi:hypothetical protein
MKYILLTAILLIFFVLLIWNSNPKQPVPYETGKPKLMKDVGEAYMENFGLTNSDFKIMSNSGINVIQSNFDICAEDSDVEFFLDSAAKHKIKVILPAGSGEAEWGYECGKENYPENQKPIWQKEKVQDWVNKWKDHPAVYAWDISNEAGSVMPNSKRFRLNADQLKKAYTDVKSVDSNHPVMIRMNGWFFYDYEDDFFREGNPFDKDMADIVMVNAYSNVEDYFDDFVTRVTDLSIDSIRKLDPDTRIIIALGAWEEPPLWYKPGTKELRREIDFVKKNEEVMGIAFFKYGAKDSEWYLPEKSPELLETIAKN